MADTTPPGPKAPEGKAASPKRRRHRHRQDPACPFKPGQTWQRALDNLKDLFALRFEPPQTVRLALKSSDRVGA